MLALKPCALDVAVTTVVAATAVEAMARSHLEPSKALNRSRILRSLVWFLEVESTELLRIPTVSLR